MSADSEVVLPGKPGNTRYFAAVSIFVHNRHYNDFQGVYLVVTVINQVIRTRVQETVHA
jgi:hypothetical protein